MANEISINQSFTAAKSGAQVQRSSATFISMTGSDLSLGTQLLGITTWDALTLGAVTAPAFIWVNNLDSTNFVQVALVTSGAQIFATIPAGQAMPILPVSGVTYYAKADTADVRVEKAAA